MTTNQHDPSTCHVCQRHAIGVGLEPARKGEPPRYLCAQCLDILEYVHSVRRMDPYELKARRGGMEAAGHLVEEWGSDLGEWEEEQVLQFCGAIWNGCADEMRRLIKSEMPF